jgi:cob(I)alamin adenosyltransferase
MARLEVEVMRVYTKTGDRGETGLIGGGRVAKDSLKIAVVGELDELNALLGLCRVEASDTELDGKLGEIQGMLFALGAEVATPVGSPISLQIVDQAAVEGLESSMDRLDEYLDDLHNFILPGGSEGAARFHHARAVCRRAERTLWALNREEPVRAELLIFLNRLSDWLFVGARTLNRVRGVEDVKWIR